MDSNTITHSSPKRATIGVLDSKKGDGSKWGFIVGGAFGLAGISMVALSTPFILPALRRHCLPYVPATDNQITNLGKAFKKHAKEGCSFLDIGSGDGRVCRLAARSKLFRQVHGVELNYLLVLYSRFYDLKKGLFGQVQYHHRDLWKFPLHSYDSICIFGVESMMSHLERYLKESNKKTQTIFACRFPFKDLKHVDEIGTGIDTVWIYKLDRLGNT